MHIAQIGVGRVGRPTAYTIMSSELADTLTVCDIKPGLAAAFAEELKHVTSSLEIDVEICSCEKDEEVYNADIILVSAGEPRKSGVKMSRRDLADKNAKIIKYISETTAPRNHGAKYIVITNPVDAMAMVCKKYSKADFVISTGTNLESIRFRSELANKLKASNSKIQGWVGGEHGDVAIPLWSTTRINNRPIDEYITSEKIALDKKTIEFYIKRVSKLIVDKIGGTEYGPAASFRDITRAIVNNTNEILSVAIPMTFSEIPEPVFVGIPVNLGNFLGVSLYDRLSEKERLGITEAAIAIYQTFITADEEL